MKKIINYTLLLLLVGAILISSLLLYKELQENKKQEKTFENLTEIVQETQKEETKKEEKTQINLISLYEINQELAGWLEIENTDFSYPVMKSNIKDHYLRKDFYKEYSSYGTPYIAENCNITSDNIVIYGHHIQNQKVFGFLENYKSKEFYENNKVIDFYTLENGNTIKNEYEIFAVFKTVAYSEKSFKYYNFVDFSNKEEYSNYINKCKNISIYETEKTPEYKQKIITLSTCEYSNKNGRLVVMAMKI